MRVSAIFLAACGRVVAVVGAQGETLGELVEAAQVAWGTPDAAEVVDAVSDVAPSTGVILSPVDASDPLSGQLTPPTTLGFRGSR